MVSEATLDNLQRYAQGMRLGENHVHLQVDTMTPEAGENVTFRWNFEDHGLDLGTLHIEGKPRVLVTTIGQRSVKVGVESFEANLRVGNDSTSVQIHPKFIIPKIEFLQLSRKGSVGMPLKIRWKSLHAERCVLRISNGADVRNIEVDPIGETDLNPRFVGDMTVVVTAFSKHADMSESAMVSFEKTIQIKVPPVTIYMPRKRISAGIGDSVCFSWNVLGSTSVSLHALDRNEIWSVPACGKMHVQVDYDQERFRLTAASESGQEKKVEFKVEPEILRSLSNPINLENLGY